MSLSQKAFLGRNASFKASVRPGNRFAVRPRTTVMVKAAGEVQASVTDLHMSQSPHLQSFLLDADGHFTCDSCVRYKFAVMGSSVRGAIEPHDLLRCNIVR